MFNWSETMKITQQQYDQLRRIRQAIGFAEGAIHRLQNCGDLTAEAGPNHTQQEWLEEKMGELEAEIIKLDALGAIRRDELTKASQALLMRDTAQQ